ncbi:MAG: HAMP domain-containing protein [Neisseriaceae bacterium]|nr:HAMP domain-containing protein [Neisseriaceae bacterium]
MLAVATGNTSKLSEYFWWILIADGILLLALAVVVGKQLWTLHKNHQNRVFGAKLARKLSLMFALVAIIPSILLFAVSAQFISHSIKSWFGDETEVALDRSLNLSKAALEFALDETVKDAVHVQIELVSHYAFQHDFQVALNRLSEPLVRDLGQIAVYDVDAQVRLGERSFDVGPAPSLPYPVVTKGMLAKLSLDQPQTSTSSLGKRLYSEVWLPIPNAEQKNYALLVRAMVPEKVAQDALLIEAARSKYAEMAFAKDGLQTFYMITLLLATLLSIMLALVGALFFSQRFTAPLLALAAATKAVARGDFTKRSPVFRSDEFGTLSSMFNRMTEQLQNANEVAETNRRRQEAAKTYLETVLASLTAGVLAFSTNGYLRAYNRSAEEILGLTFTPLLDLPWQEWPQKDDQTLQLVSMMHEILANEQPRNAVQLDYVQGDRAQMVLAKITPLAPEDGGGMVLVFDDVTELVKAQKDAAWGEVAKRLAHEIRNPLTPIQLSAERLAMKLSDKLDEKDAGMLKRSTDTIVKQVSALKSMVEAFRNYAKAPSIKLHKLDLNEMIREVLTLYEGAACTITPELSNIPIIINADSGMMRQVLHNLLKNAIEAAEDETVPVIQIKSSIQEKFAILEIENNGKRFSQDVLRRAFEPYITDKPSGTGLGLSVVKKIIDEHQGTITLTNQEPTGALVKIALPLVEA